MEGKNDNAQDNILDKQTIEQIREDLLLRKQRLLNDLKDMAGGDVNGEDHKSIFPDYGDKEDENVQEIAEYSTNLSTEKVLEETSRDIENALARIENGTYGVCKYCKEPIGKKRMLARPVASTCIACKTKLQNS